jgi:hypothetical protein
VSGELETYFENLGGNTVFECNLGKILATALAFVTISPLAIAAVREQSHPRQAGPQYLSDAVARDEQLNRLGRFEVFYNRSPNKLHRALQEGLQESGLFEMLAAELNNSGLVMRTDIFIKFQDCGEANAFYDPEPQNRQIVMCYELITQMAEDFEKLNKSNLEDALLNAIYASIFVFYHELGHALIDVLQLPVVGKEEDAVDQFSAIILLNSGADNLAQKTILNAASWFGIKPKIPGWSEHAPNDVRFYYLVCLVYGSDPEEYEALTKILPQDRANRCPREYEKIAASWSKLLLPHFAEANIPWGSKTPRQSAPNRPGFNGNRNRHTIW